MSEYEIGKDMGELRAVVASMEERLTALERHNCGKSVVALGTLESIRTENSNAPLKFTWGRQDSGDCEIRTESVTLYPDGRYRDIAELHDHGRIYGDTFKVWMSVLAGETTIAEWRWTEYVDHGDEETKDKQGTDPGIATHWNEITSVRRRFVCD